MANKNDNFFDKPLTKDELEEKDDFFAEPIKPEEIATEEVEPSVSKLEAFTRGVAEEGTLGATDEISSAVASAMETLGENIPGTDLYKLKQLREQGFTGLGGEDKYAENKELFREATKKAEESQPEAFMAGQIGGGLASSAVGGAGLAKVSTKIPALANALSAVKSGSTLTSKVKAGAAAGAGYGALSGAGKSEAEDLEGLAADVAESTATGAAIGTAIPVVGKGLSKVGGALKSGVGTVGETLGQLATQLKGESYDRFVDLLRKTGDKYKTMDKDLSVGRLNKAYEQLGKQAMDKSKIAQEFLEGLPPSKTEDVISQLTQRLQGGRNALNLADTRAMNYIKKELANQNIGEEISPVQMREILKDIKSKGWSKGQPLASDASETFRNIYSELNSVIRENAPDEYRKLMDESSVQNQIKSKLDRVLGYNKATADFSKKVDGRPTMDYTEVEPLQKISPLINPEKTKEALALEQLSKAVGDTDLSQDLTLQAYKQHVDDALQGSIIAAPSNIVRMIGMKKLILKGLENQQALEKLAPSEINKAVQSLASKQLSKVVSQPTAEAIAKSPTEAIKSVAGFLTSPRGVTMLNREPEKSVTELTSALSDESPQTLYDRAAAKLPSDSPALKTLKEVLSEQDDKVREEKLRNLMRQPAYRRLLKGE